MSELDRLLTQLEGAVRSVERGDDPHEIAMVRREIVGFVGNLERDIAALREKVRAFLGRLDRSPFRASEMADWDELFDLNHASNLNPSPVKDTEPERVFPVMHGGDIKGVPWTFIAPHNAQALRNHDQTVQRLAERGGCSPCEILAIVEGRRWHKIAPHAAEAGLIAALQEWRKQVNAAGTENQRQGADSPCGQVPASEDPLNAHQPNKAGKTAARENASELTPIAQSAPATAAGIYAREAFARDPAWNGSTPPFIYNNAELVDCLLQVYARSCTYQTRGLHERWCALHAELMQRLESVPSTVHGQEPKA